MSLLRRSELTPEQQAEREQQRELKSVRLARVQKARSATRVMQSPEPRWGIYVSVLLVAISMYSFFSADVYAKTSTVKGKTHVTYLPTTHPPQALLLLIFAVGAATTIYWRRRLVTGIAFMLAAAVGLDILAPQAASGLQYVAFGAPAVYVLWMLIFRMNKEQKELLAEMTPATRGASGAARNSSRRAAATPASDSSRGRRGSRAPATTATGRALPPSSGRYTPPRAKSRAAQRKATESRQPTPPKS